LHPDLNLALGPDLAQRTHDQFHSAGGMKRGGLLQLGIQELDASRRKLHVETGGSKLQFSNVEKHS
jgi:hypothetical protein